MRRHLLIWLVLGLGLSPDETVARPNDESSRTFTRGLMPARTQNPIFLLFLRMPPSRMWIPTPGGGSIELSSDYSSFFRTDDRPPASRAVLDGELWRNTLRARLGLGRSLALQIEIPTLYGGGGFLDSFIEEYHDLFGFNQEGRDKNPDDQYDFLLTQRGTLAYRLPENELGLGDISLTLDWAVRDETERGPMVLLRASIELPTGDERQGFGSGHTDGGFGVAFGKRLGAYSLLGDLAYQLQTAPDAFALADVGTRDNWVVDLGVERALGASTSLLLQLGFEESPVTGTALPAVDDNSASILLGLSWSTSSRWRLEAFLLEDLDGESKQDFTAHLGVSYAW